MSTRSQIGIFDSRDGRLDYVFCHWDGNVQWVGQRLLGFYDTEQKVRELISNGDIKSLGNSVEVTDFYGDPSSLQKTEADSLEHAALSMFESPIEFVYIFDVESRSWVYASYESKEVDGGLEVKPIPRDSSSGAWDDYVSRKDAESDIRDMLDTLGGVYALKDDTFYSTLQGTFQEIESIDISKRGNEVVFHCKNRKNIRMSSLSGYEVCKLANAMAFNSDKAVMGSEQVSERRRKSCSKCRSKSHRTESFGRKVSRRYESVEDGWIRSYDDLYDLPFMEGESNGYYGDGGSSKYHTIECSIDDGKFFCRYETHDVGAIVEDFFDTRHMKTGRSTEMRPEDFTEEYVKQWVEDALLSGDFVEYYDVETLWDERDNSIRIDDLYRSLEARAKKQEDIMLQAEWDAVSEILEELGMEM